jgi:hypothetical protein
VSTTRIPTAEITGVYGAIVKRFSKKLLGRVPESVGVYWHNPAVLKATMGMGAKAQKWKACNLSLKSFAHMAVAGQVGCSWCLDFGYFQAFNEKLDVDKAREQQCGTRDRVRGLRRLVRSQAARVVVRADRPTLDSMSDDPFIVHRSLLVTIAYELLGSVADAEDTVQHAWLRWDAMGAVRRAEVADPRAYLVRIASRQALNRHARWPAAGRRTSAIGCPNRC